MAKRIKSAIIASQIEREIKRIDFIDGFWDKIRMLLNSVTLNESQVAKLQHIAEVKYAENL